MKTDKIRTLLTALFHVKTAHFAGIISLLNFVLFHVPFFHFVWNNINSHSLNGIIIVASLIVLVLTANFLVFYLVTYLSHYVGKFFLIFFFIGNAIALYFINTYNVIIDESMMGNVFNTNYEESTSYFSIKMVLYVVLMGIVPSCYIVKAKLQNERWRTYGITSAVTLLLVAAISFANASNWLWVDKNSKVLGALVMPWSYTVNTSRYFIHQSQDNAEETLLPDATIADNEKAVMVLVIGESARRQNFSLYGYEKKTNPLLEQTPNVHCFKANSCATYTTASVKCILSHEHTNKLYEVLPNYLYRAQAAVTWRSNNWGEPPLHIETYQRREDLNALCINEKKDYDEILLAQLKEQIVASDKSKVLIVLHSSTSHGPTYSKKYPPEFEVFKPVCNSVDLGECSQAELINAYDNTIVYTDYLLHRLIEELAQLHDYKSAMIYVSDHGESLGENNLYMHGVPMSIAPKEQYEIPFIVWVSDSTQQLKPNDEVSQHHVFHSVLHFLHIQSPIYNEDLNIFQ